MHRDIDDLWTILNPPPAMALFNMPGLVESTANTISMLYAMRPDQTIWEWSYMMPPQTNDPNEAIKCRIHRFRVNWHNHTLTRLT